MEHHYFEEFKALYVEHSTTWSGRFMHDLSVLHGRIDDTAHHLSCFQRTFESLVDQFDKRVNRLIRESHEPVAPPPPPPVLPLLSAKEQLQHDLLPHLDALFLSMEALCVPTRFLRFVLSRAHLCYGLDAAGNYVPHAAPTAVATVRVRQVFQAEVSQWGRALFDLSPRHDDTLPYQTADGALHHLPLCQLNFHRWANAIRFFAFVAHEEKALRASWRAHTLKCRRER